MKGGEEKREEKKAVKFPAFARRGLFEKPFGERQNSKMILCDLSFRHRVKRQKKKKEEERRVAAFRERGGKKDKRKMQGSHPPEFEKKRGTRGEKKGLGGDDVLLPLRRGEKKKRKQKGHNRVVSVLTISHFGQENKKSDTIVEGGGLAWWQNTFPGPANHGVREKKKSDLLAPTFRKRKGKKKNQQKKKKQKKRGEKKERKGEG